MLYRFYKTAKGLKKGHFFVFLTDASHHLVQSISFISASPRLKIYLGKRLFRLWLCMPLQEVSAINARYWSCFQFLDILN